MSEIDLDGLALDVYAELAMRLVGGALGVTLCDAGGEVLWHQHRDGETPPEMAVFFPPNDAEWQRLDEYVFARHTGDGRTVYAHAIRSGHASGRYFLCLLHDARAAERLSPAPEVARIAVAGLSRLLGSRQALQHELNTSTDELIRRYEELNLVYNTDTEVRDLGEGAIALNRIVENCTEYLGVDVTALYLTGKDRVMLCGSDGVAPDGEKEMVRKLRPVILDWMISHDTSAVINDATDRETAGLDLPDGYRIVACPLRDLKGRVRGVLAILNRTASREFENGDRNLLTVMADKASKVIRANYDTLTGLMTREGFERTVRTVMPDATRGRREICLLHANVDQLQLVNDTFGHETGDDLIRRVADTLRSQLRGNDRIARLGGDEFGVLLADCSEDNARGMAERLVRKVGALEVAVGTQRLDAGISVGVVQITKAFDSVVGAMAAADLACSAAKEHGRDRAYIYRTDDEDMRERRLQMNWVGKLQRAIKEDRFELFCQVIAPAQASGKPPHYEILLRMLGDDGEFVSPGLFMPVAERYHMMPAVDRWVVGRSLELLASWWRDNDGRDSVFAINLSGQTLTDQRTLDFIIGRLRASGVDPRRVCFEITETAAISNLSGAQNFIAALKELGCRFALDDFGAGVTSFTSLRALDVDYLKIDGSFVKDMIVDSVSYAMVAAINNVGQTMNLDTIAEFVESEAVADRLAELGVDFLQGYDIGRPRPLVEQLRELGSSSARTA